jgi:hypothetical protein
MTRTKEQNITLQQIIDALEADCITGSVDSSIPIETVCASDLMSDVLAFSTSRSLLLTGLTNPQVVRTAEVTEITAICFVFNKVPQQETIELAENNGVTILTTPLSLYCASGVLYNLGIPGCSSKAPDK